MRDAKGFARDAVEKVAFDGLGRRIGDRMDESVEPFPMGSEIGEELVDLRVVRDVAGENQRAVEFAGEFGDALQ